MYNEVTVIEQDPFRSLPTFDTRCGRSGFLHSFENFIGNRLDLPFVGTARDHKVIGKARNFPQIEHNWIGTDLLSARDLGNTKCGIVIIGGSSNTIRYNTVCHSGAQGIYVMMGSGNTITGNQLLDNAA